MSNSSVDTYLIKNVWLHEQVSQTHDGHWGEQSHEGTPEEQPATTLSEHGGRREAYKYHCCSQ